MRQIRNHAGENIPKILLGNKCDLGIKVVQSDIDEICKEFGLTYFETSAKINRNINESFKYIAKEIVNLAKIQKEENEKNDDLQQTKNEKEKKGVRLSYKDENHDISGKCQC